MKKGTPAMSTYSKLAADAGDQYLASLAQAQETFLKYATELASRFSTPAAPLPAFAAAIPTAQEVTDAGFAFTQKLLKQQKDFTEKLFATSAAK